MADNIEMEPVGSSKEKVQPNQSLESSLDIPELSDGGYWAWACAGWLTLLSLVLLLFPRFVLFLSLPSSAKYTRESSLTPLERFLATHFGILLFGISIGLITSIPSANAGLLPPPIAGPSRHPLLVSLTITNLVSCLLAYNTPSSQIGSLSTIFYVFSGFIGLWGLWTIVFAGSGSYSKKTGADKHTSSFLFGNKNAASVQKKEWRKAQKEKR